MTEGMLAADRTDLAMYVLIIACLLDIYCENESSSTRRDQAQPDSV